MNFRITIQSAMAMLMIGMGNLLAQEDEAIEEQSAIIVSSNLDMGDGATGTRVMAIDAGSLGDGPMFFADSFDGNFEFSAGFAGNTFSMLNNPSVQKDLQLVDEQLKQINDTNREFGEKIKEQMEAIKDDNGNFSIQNGEGLGQLINQLKQQQQEQIAKILLPNQQQRLDQVNRQMKIKQQGTAKTLADHLAKELELTDEQLTRIESRSKELQQEITAKISELKAKAKDELLGELTRDQRKKLDDLVGDPFIEKEEDSNNGARRFIRPLHSAPRDF